MNMLYQKNHNGVNSALLAEPQKWMTPNAIGTRGPLQPAIDFDVCSFSAAFDHMATSPVVLVIFYFKTFSF